MLAGEHGGIGLAADHCTNPLDFVRRDSHPYTAATNQNSSVGSLRDNRRGDLFREQWIICAFLRIRAKILYLTAQLIKILLDLNLQWITDVVTSNCNTLDRFF